MASSEAHSNTTLWSCTTLPQIMAHADSDPRSRSYGKQEKLVAVGTDHDREAGMYYWSMRVL